MVSSRQEAYLILGFSFEDAVALLLSKKLFILRCHAASNPGNVSIETHTPVKPSILPCNAVYALAQAESAPCLQLLLFVHQSRNMSRR